MMTGWLGTVILRGVALCVLAIAAAMAVGRALPQAGQIAFVSQRTGNSDIFLMDVQRVIALNLTRHPSNDWGASWSPDGAQFVFVSNRDGGTAHLHLYTVASGQTTPLTQQGLGDMHPAWSPDGTRIAFSSYRGTSWGLFVLEPACAASQSCDTRMRMLDDRPRERPTIPLWSPDGRLAAALREDNNLNGIYVSEGGQMRQLTGSHLYDSFLSWSPDGSSIAFTSLLDGNLEVYSVDTRSGELVNLSQGDTYDGKAQWSPDGQTLAFASARAGAPLIYLLDPADGTLRPLVDEDPASYPAWSPDGRWLVMEKGQRRQMELVLVDTASAEVRWLTHNRAADFEVSWRPPG